MANGEQTEMRFSPISGEFTAKSHRDLMDRGIFITTRSVAEKWGEEAATEYQAWQVQSVREQHARNNIEAIQAPGWTRAAEAGVFNPGEIAVYVMPAPIEPGA
jgi:hypothetical protein